MNPFVLCAKYDTVRGWYMFWFKLYYTADRKTLIGLLLNHNWNVRFLLQYCWVCGYNEDKWRRMPRGMVLMSGSWLRIRLTGFPDHPKKRNVQNNATLSQLVRSFVKVFRKVCFSGAQSLYNECSAKIKWVQLFLVPLIFCDFFSNMMGRKWIWYEVIGIVNVATTESSRSSYTSSWTQ